MPYIMLYTCDVCGKNLKSERCNSDGQNWLTLECLRSTDHEATEGSNALRLSHTHIFCSIKCLSTWAPKALEVEKELLEGADNIPIGNVRGRFVSKKLKGVHLP